MPENTPLHISEALRRGLAKIITQDHEGKRLPTAYIMAQLSHVLYEERREEAENEGAPSQADLDKAIAEWMTTASDVEKAKWQLAQAERFAR